MRRLNILTKLFFLLQFFEEINAALGIIKENIFKKIERIWPTPSFWAVVYLLDYIYILVVAVDGFSNVCLSQILGPIAWKTNSTLFYKQPDLIYLSYHTSKLYNLFSGTQKKIFWSTFQLFLSIQWKLVGSKTANMFGTTSEWVNYDNLIFWVNYHFKADLTNTQPL